jgi:hypothetical protein
MISSEANACWHPSGVRSMLSLFPGVSLRSTPGYLLSSLRDEEAASEMLLRLPQSRSHLRDEVVFLQNRLAAFLMIHSSTKARLWLSQ